MNIFDAVTENDVNQINYLLQKGVDPNVCEDDAHITPLHFAAQNNALEAAQLLITAGADPTHQTKEGDTPLDIAKSYKHKEMINLLTKLIYKPFDLNLKDTKVGDSDI